MVKISWFVALLVVLGAAGVTGEVEGEKNI